MAGNELHNLDRDENEDLILYQVVEAQKQLEQNLQKQSQRSHERREQPDRQLDRIGELLNSMQLIMCNFQSKNPTPEFTPPLPTPSTTPKSSDATPKSNLPSISFYEYFEDFTAIRHEEGNIHNLFLDPDEIEKNTTKLSLPSLSYFEYFEDFTAVRHLERDAHNMFDEMLPEPKSTIDELEVDSISESSPGGPKMDDEVLGKRIFVKDRGKREVNMPTSFVIRDFVVEADQTPLNDEIAVEKLEAVLISGSSSRGLEIVEEIRIEAGIELNFVGANFGNHYYKEQFAKSPSVVKYRGKQVESKVEELGFELNFVGAELENQNNGEQFLSSPRLLEARGERAVVGCCRLVNERICPKLARRNNDGRRDSWSRRIKKRQQWLKMIRSDTELTEELIPEKQRSDGRKEVGRKFSLLRVRERQFAGPTMFVKDRGKRKRVIHRGICVVKNKQTQHGEQIATGYRRKNKAQHRACINERSVNFSLRDKRSEAWPHRVGKEDQRRITCRRRRGPKVVRYQGQWSNGNTRQINFEHQDWSRRIMKASWLSRQNSGRRWKLWSRRVSEKAMTWGRRTEKQGKGRIKAWLRRVPKVNHINLGDDRFRPKVYRRNLRDVWFRQIVKGSKCLDRVLQSNGDRWESWSLRIARYGLHKELTEFWIWVEKELSIKRSGCRESWSRRIAIRDGQNRSRLHLEFMKFMVWIWNGVKGSKYEEAWIRQVGRWNFCGMTLWVPTSKTRWNSSCVIFYYNQSRKKKNWFTTLEAFESDCFCWAIMFWLCCIINLEGCLTWADNYNKPNWTLEGLYFQKIGVPGRRHLMDLSYINSYIRVLGTRLFEEGSIVMYTQVANGSYWPTY